MIQNNSLFILLLTHIVCVQSTLGMNNNHAKPQSLCQYFKIGDLNELPQEMKYRIASSVIGKGGWWYQKTTLSIVIGLTE